MEITGRITAALGERGGTSQRTGTEWKVASYVLETVEQYPKHLCFEVFGVDRIAQMNIQVGEMLTVSFDIDAHEYNGRWYNSIRAFRVDRNVAAPGVVASAPDITPISTSAPSTAPQAPFPSSPIDALSEGGDSNLPF